MDITNSWILGVAFLLFFFNVFAKNYVVMSDWINLVCLQRNNKHPCKF